MAVVKPHELTYNFGRPAIYQPTMPAPNPPDYAAIDNAQSLAPFAADRALVARPASPMFQLLAPLEDSPLYRALEVLQVKSRVHDTPVGGRVAGKVNVNTLWDRKVFDALLDQNAGSGFTALEVDTMWTEFVQSRTPAYPAVGATADESATPTAPATALDRPFKSFGAPVFAASGNRVGDSGIDDTLLRQFPTDPTATNRHLLFSGQQATHPYQKAEPLRKILNNVTTTTDTFLLIYTVSFFEVRNPIQPNEQYYPAKNGVPVVLGKEVYREVPGDLRTQFVAVLDRSNLTVPESPKSDSAVAGYVAGQPDDPATPYTPLSAAPEGGLWVIETASDLVDVNPAGGTYSVQVNLYADPDRTAAPFPGTSELPLNTNIVPPVATGSYATRDEDRDPTRNFSIAGGNGTPGSGTRFAIGTGRQRLVLEALGNNPANPWTYDPLSGRTRIPVQVINSNPAQPTTATPVAEEPTDPGLRSYPAGTMLSNARFGARFLLPPLPPSPSYPPGTRRGYGLPGFDAKTPSPQVPLFARMPSP